MSAPERDQSFRDRTRCKLRDIVADAAGEPPLFVPVELRDVGPNAVADLRVRWRCHPKLPEPDECELAILELLYLRGRTRAKQLLLLLDTFSPTTINRRLKRLTRLGVVRRFAQAPRGYELDPWLRQQADYNQNCA